MPRLVEFEATGPIQIEPQEKPVFICAVTKKFPFCDGTHKACKDEARRGLLDRDRRTQAGRVGRGRGRATSGWSAQVELAQQGEALPDEDLPRERVVVDGDRHRGLGIARPRDGIGESDVHLGGQRHASRSVDSSGTSKTRMSVSENVNPFCRRAKRAPSAFPQTTRTTA